MFGPIGRVGVSRVLARLIVMKIAMAYRSAAVAGAATLLAVAAAACGGAKDTSGDPLVVGGAAETIVMKDTSYKPGNLQVSAGAAITFTNEDGALHDAKAKDADWETGDLNKGDSETIVFSEPGEFAYYCEFHPSMKAKITVVDDVSSDGSATPAPD